MATARAARLLVSRNSALAMQLEWILQPGNEVAAKSLCQVLTKLDLPSGNGSVPLARQPPFIASEMQLTSLDTLLLPMRTYRSDQITSVPSFAATPMIPNIEKTTSLDGPLIDDIKDEIDTISWRADSVRRKRKKKMNKHKHAKRRKLNRHKK